MSETSIEWTDTTWNPVTGCTKTSSGCRNCYAERMAARLQAMGQPNYRNGFAVTCHPHMLDYPLHLKQPRNIFVNSMSDLFHEDVPEDFIRQVFEVMATAPRHRLGHRGRRKWPRRPPDAPLLGGGPPSSVRRRLCALLLQAVGRRPQESRRP